MIYDVHVHDKDGKACTMYIHPDTFVDLKLLVFFSGVGSF